MRIAFHETKLVPIHRYPFCLPARLAISLLPLRLLSLLILPDLPFLLSLLLPSLLLAFFDFNFFDLLFLLLLVVGLRVCTTPSVWVPTTVNCPYFSSNSCVWKALATFSTEKASCTILVNSSWMVSKSESKSRANVDTKVSIVICTILGRRVHPASRSSPLISVMFTSKLPSNEGLLASKVACMWPSMSIANCFRSLQFCGMVGPSSATLVVALNSPMDMGDSLVGVLTGAGVGGAAGLEVRGVGGSNLEGEALGEVVGALVGGGVGDLEGEALEEVVGDLVGGRVGDLEGEVLGDIVGGLLGGRTVKDVTDTGPSYPALSIAQM